MYTEIAHNQNAKIINKTHHRAKALHTKRAPRMLFATGLDHRVRKGPLVVACRRLGSSVLFDLLLHHVFGGVSIPAALIQHTDDSGINVLRDALGIPFLPRIHRLRLIESQISRADILLPGCLHLSASMRMPVESLVRSTHCLPLLSILRWSLLLSVRTPRQPFSSS